MLCHKLNVVSVRKSSFLDCASGSPNDGLDVFRQLRKAVRRTVRVTSLPVPAPMLYGVGRTYRKTLSARRAQTQAICRSLIGFHVERRHDRSQHDARPEFRRQQLLIQAERSQSGLDRRMRQRDDSSSYAVLDCRCIARGQRASAE